MIRFLTTVSLSLCAISYGFASEDKDWVRQFSRATEKALWERQATDFYNELGRETASEADKRLHKYFSTVMNLKSRLGDECVLWFKEFRPDLQLSAKAPDLYNKEMNALWKYVSNNGCWTATVSGRQSDQWTRMTCADDIIRLIRGYLGGGAKY